MPYASPRVVLKFVNLWRPITCASNHPQNILHAFPPSSDVLSCISALLNSTHIMQNIHQTFTNIQLIIQAFIQHFIHITPRSWKFILEKIMHRHMLQYPSAPINLAFCSQPLMFRINFRSIAKDSYSPPSFSEINRCLIFFELFFSSLYTFYFFLLFHFSSFLLIYFMFHVSNLCGLVHSIQITISEYFWVFVCTFMYL